MARTATTDEEKIASAVSKEPTETMTEFAAWITEQTDVDVDLESIKLAQRLYPLYLKVPEVAEKIAARKAANAEKREAAKAASEEKVIERLAKLPKDEILAKLKALGVDVTEAE